MFKERLDALIKEGEGTLSKWHDIQEDYSKEIQLEREQAVQEFLKGEFSIFADEDSNVPEGLQQRILLKAKWVNDRFVGRSKGTVFGDVTTAMMGSTPRKTKKEKTPPQAEMISQPPPPQTQPRTFERVVTEDFRSVEVPDPAYIIPNRR